MTKTCPSMNTQLSKQAQSQLAQARSQGYLVTNGLQPPLAMAWRSQCEKTRRPYMRIRLSRGSSASLYLDLKPAGQQFSKDHQDVLYQLGQLMGPDFILVGTDYCFFWQVPKPKLDPVVHIIRWLLTLGDSAKAHKPNRVSRPDVALSDIKLEAVSEV